MGKYKGKSFTQALQDIVEKAFNLPVGILSKVRSKRSHAYIFISCTGKSANLIYSEIQSNEIVDEVSVLFGDIDVFIKVYATLKDLQKLITEDIFNIDGVIIHSTKTYFSLDEKCWMKYPVGMHSKYTPPPDRWIK